MMMMMPKNKKTRQQILNAVSLNNQGTDLLATGDYPEAAAAFCEAIKITKMLSSQAVAAKRRLPVDDDDDVNHGPWTLEAVPVLSPELLHNGFAVFENCFTAVPSKEGAVHDFTKQQCELYTAALVYNLALVYHYSGICGNKGERLDKALGLYELSSSLIQSLEESRDGLALFMAVANNTASLSLVLSDYDIFESYRNCLHELLKERRDFYLSFFSKNMTVSARHRPNALVAHRTSCSTQVFATVQKIPAYN